MKIGGYVQILLATLFFGVNWGTDEGSKKIFEKFAFLAVCRPKNPQKSPENGKFDEKRHFSNIYTIIFSLLIIFFGVNWDTDEGSKKHFEKFGILAVCRP